MASQQMQIQSFVKGSVIFRQGEEDKVLYKILTGEVEIYSDYGGPHEICLSSLQSQQCFGEMSILEDCPRSATAVAKVDVSLMSYPEKLMGTFVHQNPGFALEIMKNLSGQLRNSTSELEKMHRMLLKLTERKTADNEIQEYIRRHTTYSPDGNAVFRMKV